MSNPLCNFYALRALPLYPLVRQSTLTTAAILFTQLHDHQGDVKSQETCLWLGSMHAQVEPAIAELLSSRQPGMLAGVLRLLKAHGSPGRLLPAAIEPHLSLLVPSLPTPAGESAHQALTQHGALVPGGLRGVISGAALLTAGVCDAPMRQHRWCSCPG